jgi:hypothetical protein
MAFCSKWDNSGVEITHKSKVQAVTLEIKYKIFTDSQEGAEPL